MLLYYLYRIPMFFFYNFVIYMLELHTIQADVRQQKTQVFCLRYSFYISHVIIVMFTLGLGEVFIIKIVFLNVFF